MSKKRAPFLVFEGVGGSGKTTQIDLTYEYLTEKGVSVIKTREPGGVAPSERIRELIFKLGRKEVINADHQTALFFASRHFWLEDLVIPTLNSGTGVLTDRFDTTTGAYQGHGEGADLESIEKLSGVVCGAYRPNLVILFDLDTDTAMKRRVGDDGGDPFDRKGIQFFEKIRRGYLEMADANWGGSEWKIINANPDADTIFKDVRNTIDKLFGISK